MPITPLHVGPGVLLKSAAGPRMSLTVFALSQVTMDVEVLARIALAQELEQAGVRHEMITYSGAPHAFTVFGSERYRADADAKSWARFADFLTATLR